VEGTGNKKEAERGRRRERARLEGGEVGIKRKRKGVRMRVAY